MDEAPKALGLSFADALRLTGVRLGDRALIGPRTVQIDLTDQCNNNCIGCWARSPFLHSTDDYDGLDKGSLPLESVVDLLDQLREMQVEQIFLGGGGEPLCHPDLIEVVRQAKTRGFEVVLNTNFTLADESTLFALAKLELDLLIVSLWAGTSTTYARIHPNKSADTFKRICNTLIALKDAKQAGKARLPRVKIYDVLCSINAHELEEMVHSARDLGAEEIDFAVFDPIPGRTGHLILTQQQIAEVKRTLEHLDRPPGLEINDALLLQRLSNVDVEKGVYDNGRIDTIPCYSGWFYARITTTGQVHSCLKSHRIPVGETAQRPFWQAWYGEGQDDFRRNTLKLDYTNPYLAKIGHDINFALPGCYRICDNLGMNLGIQRLAQSLPEMTLGMLELMEQAAARGGEHATPEALRGIYDHFAQVAQGGSDDQIAVEPVGDASPKIELNVASIDGASEQLAKLCDIDVPRLDLFDAKLPGAALLEHAKLLQRIGSEHGVDVVGPDSELCELARVVDQRLEQGTDRADLLRGLGAVLGGVYAGPYTLHLDLSNRCASDCRYCWFHSPLSAQRDDPYRLHGRSKDALLDIDLFEDLLRDLERLGMPGDVVLSGKGEPLLHPDLGRILAALTARGAFTTLISGGLPLERCAQTLVRGGLGRLYVSLSAPDAATYARLHDCADPKADFQRIVRGIEKVRKLRDEAGSAKPELVSANVLCAANAEMLIEIAEQAAELGVDFLRLQLMAVEPYNAELKLAPQQIELLRRDLPQALRIAQDGGVHLMDNLEQQLESLSEQSGDWSAGEYDTRPCLNGWYFSRVWADGRVSFCCMPRIVGDLHQTGFYELWRSEQYCRYRLAARSMAQQGSIEMLDGTPLRGPQCDRCPNYEMNSAMQRILEQNGLLRFLI
ncbi:MAG: radical SAM protein [Candidatus Alcyoniella australis]|nr:radical SAM protein [Candidatus Alcyoniella australis]